MTKGSRRLAAALLAITLAMGTQAAEPGIAATATQIHTHAAAHRVLVLGEYHGTRETPLLLAELMEAYSRGGVPVVLALEVPRAEHARLKRYLASNGDAAARAALAAGPFWQIRDDQHDGRRSHDMRALIEAVRVLKSQGRDVAVAGVDVDVSEGGNQSRDDAMAQQVRRLHDALPVDARLLVLTGNVHAMLSPPAGAPKEMQLRPLASQLRDLALYSVRVDAARGNAWGCFERCRAVPLRERSDQQPRVEQGADRTYDLWVFLPQLSVGRLAP